MRLCRFGSDRYGLVRENLVYDLTDEVERCAAPYERLEGDPVVRGLTEITAALSGLRLGEPVAELAAVHLDSPVRRPTKVICAPVNYRKHVDEAEADKEINSGRPIARLEEAGLFLKATSCLVGPGTGIALRFPDRRTDHEVEVAVVIGTTTRDVAESDALDRVAGYALALDVTLRGTEDRSFRKSIDTYGVLGPYLLTGDEIRKPTDTRFDLAINGEVRQEASTQEMVKSIPELIAWASAWYTLHPGDVIMTGTPQGVGALTPGDVIDCTLGGLASMRVHVREATS